MANIYKSRYTGEQVDDLLGKAAGATEVVAIPLDDDPNYLGAIRVNGTPYLIPVSEEVIANDGTAEGAYLFTLTIGDQKYLLPAYVSANPAESGAQNLTKIAIGSTIYNIPSGTLVLANDATPTTTELTTVSIGGVNYVIPKGATVLTNDGAVEGGFLYTLTVNGNKFKMPPYIKVNNDVEGDPTSTLTKIQIGSVVYQFPTATEVVTYNGENVVSGGETLISFTIGATSYQAVDGMTWDEWVKSEYNTDGFRVQALVIIDDDGVAITLTGGGFVTPTDLIIADGLYGVAEPGGSN